MTVALGPPPQEGKNPSLDRWMYLLWKRVISTVSSTLHNSLSDLQGGTTSEYYHLTAAEYSAYGTAGAISNVVSSSTVVAADTSYIVAGYLDITDTLDVQGNVAIL